jgi:hypothetical protein
VPRFRNTASSRTNEALCPPSAFSNAWNSDPPSTTKLEPWWLKRLLLRRLPPVRRFMAPPERDRERPELRPPL